MPLDKDLQSIQEMRDVVQKEKQAQLEFRRTISHIESVCKAMPDTFMKYLLAKLKPQPNEETRTLH